MMPVQIPNNLHICPGCDAVGVTEKTYCERCQDEVEALEAKYRRRDNRFEYLPRVQAGMAAASRRLNQTFSLAVMLAVVFVLIYETVVR